MVHFWLCSACYTALQMKNSTRSASAIIQATTENRDDSATNVEKPKGTF